jgi:hypothetical protein
LKTARLSLGLAVLLVAATASASVKVETEPGADFSDYRTYAWKEGAPALYAQIQQKIVESIDRELSERGLTRVEGEADLYVTTYAHGAGQGHVVTDKGFWGRDEGLGGVATVSSVQVSSAGTLVVYLIDAETEKPVWRGWAEKTMGDNPSKALRKVEKVIRKLFREYPSGP